MEATFINKQYDNKFYYYDLLYVDESGELLRLNGAIFPTEPTEEDFINRAIEIAAFNLPDYELTRINF